MKHKLTRLTSLLLAFIMTFSMLLVPVEAAEFSDVPNGSWYAGAVDYVYEKGWMVGVGDSTFAPNLEVTRGMFVTVLAKYAQADLSAVEPAFTDTPAGAWYTGPCAWAAEKGITAGAGDGLFLPNRSITRQDLVAILYRFIEKMGYSIPTGAAVSFNDMDQASAYAVDAVNFCASAGLVAGVGDGGFHPLDTATRSQLAVILMKLDSLVTGSQLPAEPHPAQSFDGEAGDDMSISVNAPEGALPENAGMALSRVTDEQALEIIAAKAQTPVLAAADISFIKDGAEIEPDAPVQVQIGLDGLENIENPVVVHLNDRGNLEYVSDVEMVSTNRAGTAKALRFYAKDFSVYAVLGEGGEGQNARLTVEFYDSDREGAEPAKTCTVTRHDIPIIENVIPDPAFPQVQDGMSFCGWVANKRAYTAEDLVDAHGTYKDCSLDVIRDEIVAVLNAGVKEGDTFKVYAMYFNTFTVTFLNETGSTVVKSESIFTKQRTYDYEIFAAYSPENQGYAFRGWTVVGDSSLKTYQNYETYSVDSDVSFKAYVRMGKWLTFYEKTNNDDQYKGATYTPPKFILDSALKATDQPANPTLDGYTFDDWYIKGTNQKFVFSDRTLDRNYDLEAHWIRNTKANYKVLFWLQNLAGDGYDFDKSQVVVNATVDANTNVVVAGSGNDTYVTVDGQEVRYKGFKVNHAETKTVAPDGNTVVNVYFDRNTYVLTFQEHGASYTQVSSSNVSTSDAYLFGHVDGDSYTSDGVTYRWTTGYRHLYYDKTNSRWLFLTDDTNGTKLYLPYSSYSYDTTPKYYHGTAKTVKTITAPFGAPIGNYFPIDGDNGVSYSYGERWEPQNSSEWKMVMAYIDTMPAENVTFYCNVAYRPLKTMVFYVEALGTETNTVTIGGKKYVQKTSIPARFNGVSQEDFAELAGFTKDRVTDTSGNTLELFHPSSASGDDLYYEFDTSNAATVYFLYNRNKYKILYQDGTYYSHKQDSATGNQLILESDDVLHREYISESEGIPYQGDITSYNPNGANYYTPTLTGFEFKGWYLDSACQHEANNLTTMGLDGVTLYAKWQQRAIRVAIEANGGTMTNDSNFKVAEYEQISNGQEIKPTKEGYEFVGWYEEADFIHPYNFATALFYEQGNDESTADAYSAEDRANYGDPLPARDYVVGIRKIYAKWRKILNGANGLTVVYKSNDTDDPSTGTGIFISDYDEGDNRTSTSRKPYMDGSEAIGRAASEPDNEGNRFVCWEYQDHNGNKVRVYPGKPFTLHVEDAAYSEITPQYALPATVPSKPSVTPLRSAAGANLPLAADAQTLASWDFEDNSLSGWKTIDDDGDGYNWYIINNPSDGVVSHSGSYYIRSQSYYNSTALTPDNWICTPAVALPAEGGNTVTFWAKGIDSDYPSEVFSVYVTTNINSTTEIQNNGTRLANQIVTTGDYKQYSYTIPDSYAGQSVYIVLRHHAVTDQFGLAVDDMELANVPNEVQEGDEVRWVPTNEIIEGEDYLIGYVDDNGDTWLLMNYNPDTSNYYATVNTSYSSYSSSTYTHYVAYSVKAVKDQQTAAGIITDVDHSIYPGAKIDNTVWNFVASSGKYQIISKANSNKYLFVVNSSDGLYSTNSLGLYPNDYNSSSSGNYLFNWSNSQLSVTFNGFFSNTTKTVTAFNLTDGSGSKVFCAYSGDGSNLQLYRKEIIHHETTYTVRFFGVDRQNPLKVEEVPEFGAATAPDVVPPAGYHHTGWDKDFDYVTEDLDVYATFAANDNTPVYTVTFVTADYNTVLSTQLVKEGDSAVPPTNVPAPPAGYHNAGWDTDYTNVQSDLTIAVVYEKDVTAAYTITLHAVYAPKQPIKKTHVTWYANNDTDARKNSDEVAMNEAFAIETPESFEAATQVALSLTDFDSEFLGWARMPEQPQHVHDFAPEKFDDESMYETYDDNGTTKIKAYKGLTEDELWLAYHPADESTGAAAYWTVKNDDLAAPSDYVGVADDTVVSMIAPNERTPYHGLYAVYRVNYHPFYVFHSATGKIEKIDRVKCGGKYDLTAAVTPGYLYGGYYVDANVDANDKGVYGTLSKTEMENLITNGAWTPNSDSNSPILATHTINVTTPGELPNFKTYDGALYTNGSSTPYVVTGTNPETGKPTYEMDPVTGKPKLYPLSWDKNDVATAARGFKSGDQMEPEENAVYYLKEVPSSYLTSKVLFTYDLQQENKIVDLWLLSLTDDSNYQDVGFQHASGKSASAVNAATPVTREALTRSFTLLQKKPDGNHVTIKVEAKDFGCKEGCGLVAVKHLASLTSNGNPDFTMLPYWTTPDGVTIHNNALYWEKAPNAQDGTPRMTWQRVFDGTEKLYVNTNTANIAAEGDGRFNWRDDNAVIEIMFAKDEDVAGPGASAVLVLPETEIQDLSAITVPAGEWTKVLICRMSPSFYENWMNNNPAETTAHNFPDAGEGRWDKTEAIQLTALTGSHDNYLKLYYGGSDFSKWGNYPELPSASSGN